MKKCYPLELVNRVANKYQDCWNIVEDFRNDSTLPWWDKRCYIPIAAGLAIAADGDMSKKAIWNSSLEADLIVATAAWRLHKQVYLFDPAMEKVLINQADQNLKIPIDILNKIPFFCVYIETTTMEDMDGFFVHFESDTNTGELELRFLIVLKDGDIFPIPFHLIEGGTIADEINASFEKANENQRMLHTNKYEIDDAKDYARDLCCKLLQLVLYVCSKNKEMVEDPVQKKITRQPKSFQFIKDKYREVQRWNFGKKSGDFIRKFYKTLDFEEEVKKKNETNITNNPKRSKTNGTPKRPHLRKAHWHHYWIGSDNKENRTLELKWMAPMFIHKDDVHEDA